MIENTILAGLVYNEEYARKVVPFLKDEYFSDPSDKIVFNSIKSYIDKYNGLPTREALKITVSELDNISEDQFNTSISTIDGMDTETDKDQNEWLIDKTEEFCQEKAIINAVRDSIMIIDGQDSKKDRGSIPQLLTDALAVGFDTHIGHDFIDNAQDRFEFYHRKEEKIEFDLEYFNKITKGGVSRKSLIIALGGTGTGKTLFMCHFAAANMMAGLNVLYITAEMAEERIAERIDANLLDITLDDLRYMDEQSYHSRMSNLRKRTTGKLIIKEYPTSTVNVNHIRFLLNELKIKKNFKPDIVYVDYLNICASARVKQGAGGSYEYVKAIAEEFRGLGMEHNIPIFTATQLNRTGFGSSDFGMDDVSDSFGLSYTADMMFGIITSDEMEALNQTMIKQLKNRWGDINDPKRFVLGIDRSKMRLFDIEQSAQDNVMVDPSRKTKPKSDSIMDNTSFGERLDEEVTLSSKAKRKPNFKGFV